MQQAGLRLVSHLSTFASADASKNGVAREAINNVRRSTKAMTEQEARQILGISEQASWEEVLQVMFVPLSFYLPSFFAPFYVIC